jgi:alkylation response protein AidB-like acyl-CoA dehydrogenase
MSDVRDMILDTAGRLFADLVDRPLWQAAEAGECPAAAWNQVREMGLPRVLLQEANGGTGLGATDGLALIERCGYYALPLPLAETVAGNALLEGMERPVDDGVVTLAEIHDGNALELKRNGGGWTLSGTLRRVAWGRHVDRVVFGLEGADTRRRVVVPASRLDWTHGTSLAGEPRDTAIIDGLRLEAGDVATVDDAALGIEHWGALLRALQMSGAMRRALELAVAHANERSQFGRRIARFQAIQQQLAAMTGEVAAAGKAAQAASHALDGPDPALMIAIAKARVGEAAGRAAAVSHQVHGAMGFTREHTLHYYTRRLWAWRDEFGAEPEWQAQIGRRAAAQGGDALWPFLSAL